MRELIEMLGFWIDRSGATAVLREVDGGCHPATRIELALWDALEAAREDAARLDWLAGDAVLTSGWREHGTWETPALLVNSTRETCAPRDFRAAIDQARGKGVLND